MRQKEIKFEIRNAMIKRTMLGYEDHGILTCSLELDYGGIGQSFGNYDIGGKYCAQWILKILDTVGVEKWEDLPGKYVRVKQSLSKVYEIGNILENKWFNPELLK